MINTSSIGDRVRVVNTARHGDVISVASQLRKSKVRWDSPEIRDSWRSWSTLHLVRHVLDRAEVRTIFGNTLDY